MKLENLKDLEALIKLCRKYNLEAFEIGDIRFSLGASPVKQQKIKELPELTFPEVNIKVPAFNGITNPEVLKAVEEQIKTDGLTDEQLLFYSSADRIEEEKTN